MKLKIKRFDKSLPLPVHKTAGAVAVDLCARTDFTIESHQFGYIPMNVAIEIPDGYFILMAPRSSTHKLGLMGLNGVGVFDRDFCGDNDEYHFIAYNFTDSSVSIEKGTRLCQLLLIKCENFDFQEVDKMESVNRGGFGTTGVK
ncbi:MAG: dUTP diphosphatase [Candidatus Shapirobacteria bacterium]|jgi:dUTP pyrophosphatase|nr:dUTP diphosphatase [Candidatus Shapirobacteria bacterium]